MTSLAIHNPATGELITTWAADDAASVATKAQAARRAQSRERRVATWLDHGSVAPANR